MIDYRGIDLRKLRELVVNCIGAFKKCKLSFNRISHIKKSSKIEKQHLLEKLRYQSH
jgi:hypothetical protein